MSRLVGISWAAMKWSVGVSWAECGLVGISYVW